MLLGRDSGFGKSKSIARERAPTMHVIVRRRIAPNALLRAGMARRLFVAKRAYGRLAGGAIILSRLALNGLSAYQAGHTPAWLRYWPSSYSAWVSSRMPE